MWALSVKSCKSWRPLFRPFWIGVRAARRHRAKLRLRLAWLIFAVTLLASGCVSSTARTTRMETLPARPELTSLVALPDGGIMMDRRDAAELLIYIEALEQACGVSQ